MLIELTQLLRDGVPRSYSQIAAALGDSPGALLDPMLAQLERKGRISRCPPAMPCSKGGCSCSQLEEDWYQWRDAQPIQL